MVCARLGQRGLGPGKRGAGRIAGGAGLVRIDPGDLASDGDAVPGFQRD